MLADAIQSYYDYVFSRMTAGNSPDGKANLSAPINTQQKFMGIQDAQDFPTQQNIEEGLYLVRMVEEPQRGGTVGNQLLCYMLEWRWMIVGQNLGPEDVGANRGNRFMDNETMGENLRRASFPGFASLFSYGVDNNGNLVRTPYNPQQSFNWSVLKFGPKLTGDGVLYGAATVDVFAFQVPLSQ